MFHRAQNARFQDNSLQQNRAQWRRLRRRRNQRLVSRAGLTVESLERRDLLAADIVFELPSTGVYDLSVQAGNLTLSDSAGTELVSHAADDVASLTINGTAGDDTLRILETAEGLPQFSGDLSGGPGFQLGSFLNSDSVNAAGTKGIGLHFQAGAGEDAWELLATNPHTVSYFSGAADPNDATQKRGNVNIANQFTLSFDGLTPQTIDGGGGTLRVDASTDPDSSILTVRNDVTGPDRMMVTGDGGFETVFFNGFSELVIIGGLGSESFVLDSFDPETTLTSITLDGSATTDFDESPETFTITTLPETITANIIGDAGDDVLVIDETAGHVALGNINFDGGSHVLGDSVQFTGDSVGTVTISPSGDTINAATIAYYNSLISYTDVELTLVGSVTEATYVTPNQVDDITVQELSAGGAPVLTFTGTSDGLPIGGPFFADVPLLTIDTGTNDRAMGADTILYDNLATPAGIAQIHLETGDFEDSITLSAVSENTGVSVDSGAGNDFVQIGTQTFALNDILGVVTVIGGGQDEGAEWNDSVTASGQTFEVNNSAGDTLRVIDFATDFDSQYLIFDGVIEAVGLNPFNYGQFETLELITGSAVNQIEIMDTPANSTLRIQAGDATDFVTVQDIGAGSIVDISTFGGADQVQVAQTGAGSILRVDAGDDADNLLVQDTGGSSGLIALLGAGDDVAAFSTVNVAATVNVQGEAGADSYSIISAAESANVELDGGADDDVFALEPFTLGSNTTVVGGDGSDGLIVVENDDTDDTYLLDGTTVNIVEQGVTFSAAHTGVESVQVDSFAGVDDVTVTPAAGIEFEIFGGTPTDVVDAPGDRLTIVEDGLTNLSIPTDLTTGTITADGVGDVLFEDIEIITNNIVVAVGDRFEDNETIATATPLGADATINVTEVDTHTDVDVDVYEFMAAETGKLMVNATFLHADGNLDLELYDPNGTLIATSDSLTDNESVVYPALAGVSYFARVFSPAGDTNPYTLDIVTTAAPTPTSVVMDPNSDTGDSTDNLTADTQPRFVVEVDLQDFADMGIAILDGAAVLAGDTGVAVVVQYTDGDGGVQNAFADLIGTDNQSWEHTPPTEFSDGDYTVSASVFVIDALRPAPATGDPSSELAFTIDTTVPTVDTVGIAAESDTGMGLDFVTSSRQIIVRGTTTPLAAISVVPNLVGIERLDAEMTTADAAGNWQVEVSLVDDGRYQFEATASIANGNEAAGSSDNVYLDTVTPDTAQLSLLGADGQPTTDLTTDNSRPSIQLTALDFDGPAFPNNVAYRLFLAPDGSTSEILVGNSFDEEGDFINGGTITRTLALPSGAELPDGTHSLRIEVEDRAGNVAFGDTLTFTVDTVPPTAGFGVEGVANDGLRPESDSAIIGDLITNDRTPTIFGFAEEGAVVEVMVEARSCRSSTSTVATASGWELTLDLDDLTNAVPSEMFPGCLFSSGDVEVSMTVDGSTIPVDDAALTFFSDNLSPSVTAVTFPDGRDVADAMQGDDGSNALLVRFSVDVPFVSAVSAPLNLDTANNVNSYSLVGVESGVVPVDSVSLVEAIANTWTYRVEFASTLPTDELVFSVDASVADTAGNTLILNNGQSYSRAFTIPETPDPPAPVTAKIGVWAAGSVYLDSNGDFNADPLNDGDAVVRIGLASDDIFAGNFVLDANGTADGIDTLGAYGDVGTSYEDVQYRWIIDANQNGVISAADGDILVASNNDINGLPVAGRFDANDNNGDEVGVFTGRDWYLDTTHDFQTSRRVATDLRGYPMVGDFDGDGFDDLATYNERHNRFEFDLTNGTRRGWDGAIDTSFNFEYRGRRDRPVAADFDGDGIDDIGLWAPDQSGFTSDDAGEWYILVSGGESVLNRIDTMPLNGVDVNVVHFATQPFGNDIFAEFGDDYALPVAGNFVANSNSFVTVAPAVPQQNLASRYDVNFDGGVSPLDAIMLINLLDSGLGDATTSETLFADTNGDGHFSPSDAIGVINILGADAKAASSHSATSQAASSLVVSVPSMQPVMTVATTDVTSQPTDRVTDAVFGELEDTVGSSDAAEALLVMPPSRNASNAIKSADAPESKSGASEEIDILIADLVAADLNGWGGI